MQEPSFKPCISFFTAAAAAALLASLLPCKNARGQDEGWGTSTSLAYYAPGLQQKPKKLQTYEVHASLAFQEGGVLAPSPSRSPMSLRAMIGVNVLKFNVKGLGGRILHGPFVALPLSIEIGYLQDIQQYGPAVGWQFSGRPSKHWKWMLGIQVSFVTPDINAAGPGIHLGAAYYFLAGFGIFGEADIDAYFGGGKAALTAGGTAGLLITYEFYRIKESGTEE
jgi:hypothetical protein